MIKKVLATTLLMALGLAPAYAADVSGDWTISMTGPMGAETLDISIEADGNSLAITGKHSVLGDAQGTGTLDGDTITMTVGTTGDMKVGFAFEGTIDGDQMSGTREIKMESGGGGAPGGGAPGGGAPEGGPPAGGAPEGGAPEGGPPGGGAPEGAPPAGGAPEGGAPGGGAPGGGDMG
jgi:hypothetical protein